MTATGDGASGIFANSTSGGQNGTIGVTIGSDASVSGGSGNAAGIRLIDGSANTITNAGTLTSSGGVALRTDRSSAVTSGTVLTTVTSTGTITGELLAGDGTQINVNNAAGGTLVSGRRLVLGPSGFLTNHGTIDVRGRRIGTTALTGNLVQGASGRMRFDLDAEAGEVDRLHVTGAATLDGGFEVVADTLLPGTLRGGDCRAGA